MPRLHRKDQFIRQAKALLDDMRITLAEIRGSIAMAMGGGAPNVAASRVDETIARMASLPRSGSIQMMNLPIGELRAACEAIVKPGCIRREVFDQLQAHGYKGRKTGFYRFAANFTAMYRQVQTHQLSPSKVESPSNGL